MLSKFKAWNTTTRPISARIDEDLLDCLEELDWQRNTVINYVLRQYLAAVERTIAEDETQAQRVRRCRYFSVEIKVKD